MAKHSHYSHDARSFPRPFRDDLDLRLFLDELGDLDIGQRCTWPECREPQWVGPVCFVHGVEIYGHVRTTLSAQNEQILAELVEQDIPREMASGPGSPLYPAEQFVYYLMVGPATVKIGTTTNLRRRIMELRSELQYVVAIERGGSGIEHRRHQEFAAERIGRREDFRLTERLKQHIEALQPQRDELIALATP